METSCVWWIGGNTFRSMADKIGFFSSANIWWKSGKSGKTPHLWTIWFYFWYGSEICDSDGRGSFCSDITLRYPFLEASWETRRYLCGYVYLYVPHKLSDGGAVGIACFTFLYLSACHAQYGTFLAGNGYYFITNQFTGMDCLCFFYCMDGGICLQDLLQRGIWYDSVSGRD